MKLSKSSNLEFLSAPTNKDNTIKMGESIEIDTNNTCYDWTGRKFYATKRPKGWIYEGVIDLGDTNNG